MSDELGSVARELQALRRSRGIKNCKGSIVLVAAVALVRVGSQLGVTQVAAQGGSSALRAKVLNVGRCSDQTVQDSAAEGDPGSDVPIIDQVFYESNFSVPIHDWYTFTTDRADNIQIDVTRKNPVNTQLDTFLLTPYDAFPTDPGAFIIVDFAAGTFGTSTAPVATTTIGPRRIRAGRFYIAIRADFGSTDYTLRIRRGLSTEETLPDVLTNPASAEAVGGTIVVNRLTPSRYPAPVVRITVGFKQLAGSSEIPTDISGTRVRIVAFLDPSGSGRPPTGAPPTAAFDFTLPHLDYVTSAQTLSIELPGLVVRSGDLYAGVGFPIGDVLAIRYDTGSNQEYAFTPDYAITFTSADGGRSWANKSGGTVELADIRALISNLPTCTP